jgi:hypothetical protein
VNDTKQAQAVAVVAMQVSKLLDVLAVVVPSEQADREALDDARYYLRQARTALGDIENENTPAKCQ